MGIAVEFNPDLALRAYGTAGRRTDECLPQRIEKDKTYNFLKKDQRNYWLFGEIPLIETKGNQVLSRPKASIIMLEATHFVKDGSVWTKGRYQVVEVFDDDEIHFECFDKVGTRGSK
jgi:hypothetical protein